MYYKLIKNGAVIDAVDELATWLKGQKYAGPVAARGPEEADGIVASDQSASFNIEGRRELCPEWETVKIEEIDVNEYEALKEKLNDGPIEGEMPGDSEAGTGSTGAVADRAALLQRVEDLEQQVEQQAATTDMLLECLLEMSEAVYAG